VIKESTILAFPLNLKNVLRFGTVTIVELLEG